MVSDTKTISQAPALPFSGLTSGTLRLRMVRGMLSVAQMREEPYMYWKAWRPVMGGGGGSGAFAMGAGVSEQAVRKRAARAGKRIRIYQCQMAGWRVSTFGGVLKLCSCKAVFFHQGD